jgi:hypothetical protein
MLEYSKTNTQISFDLLFYFKQTKIHLKSKYYQSLEITQKMNQIHLFVEKENIFAEKSWKKDKITPQTLRVSRC